MEPSQMQKDCNHSVIDVQFTGSKGFQQGVCELCGAEVTSNDNGQTWQQITN